MILIVNDRDPKALLENLTPLFDRGCSYWIPETGPDTWRILVCREEESRSEDYEDETAPVVGVNENDSLRKYIGEIRSIWGDGKDPELPFKVKILLERLLASIDPQEPWISRLINRGLPSRILYRDREHGFIQVGHVQAKGHHNPPHDHGGCWVVYGVYHGVSEVTTYRRTDGGKLESVATLEKNRLFRLNAGAAAVCLPGEILSTLAGEHSVVLRFVSGNANAVRRYWYLWDGANHRPVAMRPAS
jgi:predicted metal-dependent enzyme (double-stranded beta helix superfamily)